MKAFFRDFLTTLFITAVIFLGLQTTIQSFIINGTSMEPNFHDGQWLLVNKILYKFYEPQRGEVIILRPPNNPSDKLIKRVIGLPGESVEIKGGTTYIHKKDGSILTLAEPYLGEPERKNFKGSKIPENEYFVLGDNRNISDDSRSGWTVSRQNIIGKAWLSTWPPQVWGLAANYHFTEEIAQAK